MSNESSPPSGGKRGTRLVIFMVVLGVGAGLMTVTYWNLVINRKPVDGDLLPKVSGIHKPGDPIGVGANAPIPRDVMDLQEQFTQAAEQHKFGTHFIDAGKELVKRHAKSPDARALLAQILLYDGQFEAAKRELEQSLALAPNQPATHVLLGTVFMKQERPADATPEYAKAVEQAPGQATYMLHLAQSYLSVGEKEKARAICQDVLDRVDSGSGDALTLMADVLAADGDFVRALANAQRAIESTPISKRKQQTYYIRKKASLLRRSGKPQQAVMTLQSLTGQELADPDVLEEMAKSWQASGDSKQAAATFEKALRTNPTIWELAAGASRWSLVAGNVFQARIYADLAQKLNPRSDDVTTLLSSVQAAERAAATQPK